VDDPVKPGHDDEERVWAMADVTPAGQSDKRFLRCFFSKKRLLASFQARTRWIASLRSQ
jgi:hypothetical protein